MRILLLSILSLCCSTALLAETAYVHLVDSKYNPVRYEEVELHVSNNVSALGHFSTLTTNSKGMFSFSLTELDTTVQITVNGHSSSPLPKDILVSGNTIINTLAQILYTDAPVSSQSKAQLATPRTTQFVSTKTPATDDNSKCSITVYSRGDGGYCQWCDVLINNLKELKKIDKFSCLEVKIVYTRSGPWPRWTTGNGKSGNGSKTVDELKDLLGGSCSCDSDDPDKPEEPEEPGKKLCWYITQGIMDGETIRPIRNVLCDTKKNIDNYLGNPTNQTRPHHPYYDIKVADSPPSGTSECEKYTDCFDQHMQACTDQKTICTKDPVTGAEMCDVQQLDSEQCQPVSAGAFDMERDKNCNFVDVPAGTPCGDKPEDEDNEVDSPGNDCSNSNSLSSKLEPVRECQLIM